MKKKIICSIISALLLAAIGVGVAFAAPRYCPWCGYSMTRYAYGSDQYHRVRCNNNSCTYTDYEAHTINGSTRECTVCGEMLGDARLVSDITE